MKKTTALLAATLAASACAPDEDPHRVVGELASERIELSAEFSEPIRDILIAEGQSVSQGQALLTQDTRRAQARLDEADASWQKTQARMDELIRGPRAELITAARATLEGARQELRFRRSEMTRVREIHERGLASPDAMDKAKNALDTAEADLKLRQAQLQELLAGTTIEELAQAEQAVRQAAARREVIATDLDRHTLRAPVDGIIDSRLFEIGERPQGGQPTIILLSGEQPHARIYVPEALRVHIVSGTKALIHVDGLAEPLPGRVRWIASESTFTPYFALTERDRGHLSYVAKVDIDTDDTERLPDGVPLEVQFELDIE